MKRIGYLSAAVIVFVLAVSWFAFRNKRPRPPNNASSENRLVAATNAARSESSVDAGTQGTTTGTEVAELPPALKSFADWSVQFSALRPMAQALPESDKKLLLRYSKTLTNLSERVHFTWRLSLIDDESVVRFFMNTLTNDYREKNLTLDDSYAAIEMIHALGVLASKSDAAFAFLKQGTEISFWERNRVAFGLRGRRGVPASRSIAALGLSGRPGILPLLEQFKVRDPEYLSEICSGVTSAAFNSYLTQNYDRDAILRILTSEKQIDVYGEWVANTKEGKEWNSWLRKKLNLPPEN